MFLMSFRHSSAVVIPTLVVLFTARPAFAQLPQCIEGCFLADEERALREAGLSPGQCDAAVRFEIEADGSVGEVTLRRADENRLCNETLIAYARAGRWSPTPEGHRRWITHGWNDSQPSLEADIHMYPGGLGRDTGGRFLLTHRDPRADIIPFALSPSRLGPFERKDVIEEIRSDAPLLCAIGREPGGEVAMRTEALEDSPEDTADPFALAATTWPDFELLGAHLHTAGGSCFLLQSTAYRKGEAR